MAEQLTLAVQKRTARGKGPGCRSRVAGMVPGVYYNPKGENIPLLADGKALRKLYETAGSSQLITLCIEGDGATEKKPALIWEIQHHPYKKQMLHIDFFGADITKELRMEVPLEFVGESPAIKSNQGILQVHREFVEVICLPTNIPQSIVLDISGLDVNQSIHIADVQLPQGVRIHYEENYALAGVMSKAALAQQADKADAAAAAAAATAAEPAAEAEQAE